MKLVENLFIAAPALTTASKIGSRDVYDHMDGGLMDANDRRQFNTMTEIEKKHHLTEIFKKADYDNNGQLTKDELERWMQITSEHYLNQDVDNQWPAHDVNSDGLISWDEYRSSVYEHMSNEDFEDQDLSMEEMEKRDQRRFVTADADKDGNLDRTEFGHFLHPEDHHHMKDIVVKETLEDLDLDGDGFISEEEYIRDIYNPQNDNREGEEAEEEPQWLRIEYQHFRTIRDLDKDGKLNEAEVKNWLMPIEYDHIEAEAQHLIDEADNDKNGELSLEEVLGDYELWITSQATNWGEALTYHEEL